MRRAPMSESIVIDPRFNGPPDSANGGYTCGLLAAAIDGSAQVSLRRPPPLGRELRLERDGERALLLDDDGDLVAEAAPIDPDWDVPVCAAPAAARAAVAGSAFLVRPRPFPTCFVCGSDRPDHDGLEIYPGPLPDRDDLHAGTWTPDPSLADAGGRVRPEVVWASLDCPTSSPVANKPRPDGTLLPIVLAQLAADIRAPVEPGREHVVMAWQIAVDGRKRHAGSALFTADGELLASARALWIELRAG
jgi:hypothetical protein